MGRKNCHRIYWCMACMQKFSSEARLTVHFADGRKFGVQSIKFPKQLFYESKKIRYQTPHSFNLVADFECFMTKIRND